MKFNLQKKVWWDYLEGDLQELLNESILLLTEAKAWKQNFHDYSFIVFPASKAYEGFLKKLFLDMEFITKMDYAGKRFRIGKALNPSLERKFRDKESVYDKIVKYCGGRELAEKLWITWKQARNMLFHWFPEEKNAISIEEAEDRLGLIISSIDAAFSECKIN